MTVIILGLCHCLSNCQCLRTDLHFLDSITSSIPRHVVTPLLRVLTVLVQFGQPLNYMLACVDWLVLSRVLGRTAGRNRFNQCISVRMPELGDGIPCRYDLGDLGAGLVERTGLDNAVFGRLESVVEPAGEKIADIYNSSTG